MSPTVIALLLIAVPTQKRLEANKEALPRNPTIRLAGVRLRRHPQSSSRGVPTSGAGH